jgi:hypothetical protein
MIPICLTKIKKDKAVVILVCPLWPSQPWYPLLLEMATDIPRVFSSHPRSSFIRTPSSHTHSFNRKSSS